MANGASVPNSMIAYCYGDVNKDSADLLQQACVGSGRSHHECQVEQTMRESICLRMDLEIMDTQLQYHTYFVGIVICVYICYINTLFVFEQEATEYETP